MSGGDVAERLDVLHGEEVVDGVGATVGDGFGDVTDGGCFRFRLEDLGARFTLSLEDVRLLVGLGGVDLGLFLTFGVQDLRLLLAFRLKDLRTTVTFRLHLEFHGPADAFRRRDVLQFHTVDLDAPFVGSVVEHRTQLRVDRVA